ncbi:hypothetical protein CEUSTIGMA_g1831.t1 [Chlamydomonas eustigma]|uniref:Uncharacterized protein n=1 Tax=Chlamydomonas eustigma TaxID=1157962 RepID=A0A250WU83_9CHLO|nr:hypothetical protein CEUSTIGMA_g1831.t1 [Chlamydomonas eustigma]|eukprot:GAX74383.1 hypothetical protein CEUSTIGMA_g1831.t1 [Chlamydomonas eustigma]
MLYKHRFTPVTQLHTNTMFTVPAAKKLTHLPSTPCPESLILPLISAMRHLHAQSGPSSQLTAFSEEHVEPSIASAAQHPELNVGQRQSHSSSIPQQSTSIKTPLRSRHFILSLERAVGLHALGSDEELRASGAFSAEVIPDLPIATTWGALARASASWFTAGSELKQQSNKKDGPSSHQPVLAVSQLKAELSSVVTSRVNTVAVNLRSMAEVERRMIEASTSSASDQPHIKADSSSAALLLVSGSHPLRTLPGVNRLLPSSVDALRAAKKLKSRGLIPGATQLWAVANPNLERDASLLEKKVEHGATTILTQPPFDMAAFEAWLTDVERRGLPDHAVNILVGMPFISSPGNLAFWLSLAGCSGRPACQQLLAGFQRAAAAAAGIAGKPQLHAYCAQYNADLLTQLCSRTGVAGFHVMPITASSKKMAHQLLIREKVVAAVLPHGILSSSSSSAHATS